MSRCNVLLVMLAVALMAVAWATPVRAVEVCPYGDFETPATPGFGWTDILATDWFPSSGTEPWFRGNDPGSLDWGAGNRVSPGAYGFPENGSAWGMQSSTYGGGYDSCYTDLGVMAAEGDQYDLTGQSAGNNIVDQPPAYDLFFLNVEDDVIREGINETDFGLTEAPVWVPVDFSYTATADDVGDTLRLVLRSRGSDGVTHRALVDNISVVLTPIPEPSTLALLLMGGLGLAAYAWRRRR